MPRGGSRPGAGRKPKPETIAKRSKPAARPVEEFAPTGKKKAGTPASWPFGTADQPEVPAAGAAQDDEPVLSFETPLEYWQHVLKDPKASKSDKHSAAFAMAPYVHPKLAPVGKKDGAQDAAKKAGQGKFRAAPAPPKLVAAGGKKV